MADTLLLLDDEPHVLSALKRLLRHGLTGHDGGAVRIEAFTDPTLALQRAAELPFALALSDYRMPGMTGVQFLTALRELQPDCARVILSGFTDLDGLTAAINQAGIARFFAKPWVDHELISGLRQQLQIRQLQVENQRLADQVRLQRGELSPQEAETRRLEAMEPGITRVHWGPDGSILLEDPGALS